MSTRRSASLGRRLLPAVVMTTAASGLVALLDRPTNGDAGTIGGDAAASGDQGVVVVATTPPTVSSTVPAVTERSAPATSVAPADVPAQQPVATEPAAPDTTTLPVAGGGCAGQTIDGPTVSTRWGPVQVEAVVAANGQICDVAALHSPDSHRRSVQINNYALPILHTEVMEAQSANINGVSGATITARGYVTSLQSILDSVGS